MKATKYCGTCKTTKLIGCFHKNRARYDGLCGKCNACKSIEKKEYKRNNKEKIALQRREYETRPGVQQKRYASLKEKQEKDPCLKLQYSLRGRLSKALQGDAKRGSAVQDLGCSVQHLKLHLELFWDGGMSWSNYGNGADKWNIDHIIPLSRVDLTSRSQFLLANNYKNLQPMWYLDNISKSNR